MGYAVELQLGGAHVDRIHAWLAAEERLQVHSPEQLHVSLVVFDTVDSEALIEVTERFAAERSRFSLRLAAVGLFPASESVLYLAPAVTAELLALHADFHAALAAADLEGHIYYRPGNWIPHCTIGMDLPPAQVQTTVGELIESDLLGETIVEAINVVSFRPAIVRASFPLHDGLG